MAARTISIVAFILLNLALMAPLGCGGGGEDSHSSPVGESGAPAGAGTSTAEAPSRPSEPPSGAVTQSASIESAENLRKIASAVIGYTTEQQEPPVSLEALVDAGLLDAELLNSPSGPVADGEGDYWFALDEHVLSLDSARVLGYDRAAYARGGLVAIVFCDNHAERWPKAHFDEYITSGTVGGERRGVPANKHSGVDFQLPPPQ